MQKNLYDHIDANRRKTIIILLMFPLVLFIMIFLGFFLASIFSDSEAQRVPAFESALSMASYSLPVISVLAIIWILIAYFFGGKMILKSAKSKKIEKRDNPYVYNIVENIAISAGLPTPDIYIIEDSSMNAFATGRNPGHAAIALTTGTVDKLNKQELEGVVAHEMGHIGNYDIRLMMLTIAGIGFFTFLGEVLLRSLRYRGSSRNKKGNAAGIVLILGLVFFIFGYIIAPLLRLALSRRREYQADATAGYITRNPLGLASALEKISKDARVEALDKRPTMAAICIEDPSNKKKSLFGRLAGLYATHPKIELRIAALKEMGSAV
jgi:heat shock protein HtpX